MIRTYDTKKQIGPKLFAHSQTKNVNVNQQLFYSDRLHEKMETQAKQINSILKNQTHVHEKFSNQLAEQKEETEELKSLHQNLKRTVEYKRDILQGLMNRFNKAEEHRQLIQQQLLSLMETKKKLTEQFNHLENARKELYASVMEQSNLIKKQEAYSQKVEKQQVIQKQKEDDLVQQLNLQKLDHVELQKTVKTNEKKQKLIKEQLDDLSQTTITLTAEQREQGKMHVELYTEFSEFQAETQQSIQDLDSQIDKIIIETTLSR